MTYTTHISHKLFLGAFACVFICAGALAHTARADAYYTMGTNDAYYTVGTDPIYTSYSSGGGYVTGGGMYYDGWFGGSFPSYSSGPHYATGGIGTFTPSTATINTSSYTWPSFSSGEHYATGGGMTYTAPGYYNTSGSYSGYATPTCHLSVSPNNYINQGGSATLSWSSQNASHGTIVGVGTVPSVGTSVVSPTQTTGYTATFYGPAGQTNCYATVVVNGTTPSVTAAGMQSITLSQVPYTGLDLGPFGTVIYFSFLLALCAVLAYLLAVKKIHMKWAIAARHVFFGDPDAAKHPVYKARAVATAGTHSGTPRNDANVFAPTVGGLVLPTEFAPTSADAQDDFILGQINRGK